MIPPLNCGIRGKKSVRPILALTSVAGKGHPGIQGFLDSHFRAAGVHADAGMTKNTVAHYEIRGFGVFGFMEMGNRQGPECPGDRMWSRMQERKTYA